MVDRDKPLSFGDWMITLLILGIPFVNLISLIYWAASGRTNINKKNYARAAIAWFFIVLAFYVFLLLIGVAIPSIFGNMQGS